MRGHRAAPWHRRHRRHRDSPGSLRWICWNMLRYQSRGRSTLCRDTTGMVRKGPEGMAEPGPTPPTHRARGDGHPRLVHRPDAVVLHPAPLPPFAVLGPRGRPARWARATGGGMWGCGSPRALHGVLSGCWGAGSLRLLGRPGLVPVGGWGRGDGEGGDAPGCHWAARGAAAGSQGCRAGAPGGLGAGTWGSGGGSGVLSWGGVVEVEIQRVGAAVADDGHLLHEDRANGGGVRSSSPNPPSTGVPQPRPHSATSPCTGGGSP